MILQVTLRSAATAALTIGLGGLALAQSPAPSPPAGISVMDMGKTSMLMGANGMTLYILDTDTTDKSTCNDACAKRWPPLTAPADAKPHGAYTIIKRDDGTRQWAYKGKPLYFFAGDKASMDMTGDGLGGKWHVAKT